MKRSNPRDIRQLILKERDAVRGPGGDEYEAEPFPRIEWPVPCTVGPGLEGAIACESEVGYVNGTQGRLVYRGYDIFDLCANCCYEEVAFLLLYGELPNRNELAEFRQKLKSYAFMPKTLRLLMTFPIETMSSMSALRLGTNLSRQVLTNKDLVSRPEEDVEAIGADEDSIAMETAPRGETRAVYEFRSSGRSHRAQAPGKKRLPVVEAEDCCHLMARLPSIVGAVARVRTGRLPLEPHPDLGLAANLLYMMSGRVPTGFEARVMDVALILHADHGMNASTFAALVVASTLADAYFAVGAGISALSGPLHGGANEQVMLMLDEIGSPRRVRKWVKRTLADNERIMGFGHRVYKTHDPRARILKPLAERLVAGNPHMKATYRTAAMLEREAVAALGEKKLFPNVDFYSGIVYSCLGIPREMFTPVFAAGRVAGWTARIYEYLKRNRIFRPRAAYVGPLGKQIVPLEERR